MAEIIVIIFLVHIAHTYHPLNFQLHVWLTFQTSLWLVEGFAGAYCRCHGATWLQGHIKRHWPLTVTRKLPRRGCSSAPRAWFGVWEKVQRTQGEDGKASAAGIGTTTHVLFLQLLTKTAWKHLNWTEMFVCVAANRLWFTTVLAAGRFTSKEWAGDKVLAKSKMCIFPVSVQLWKEALPHDNPTNRLSEIHSQYSASYGCVLFSCLVFVVCCDASVCTKDDCFFSVKYSAAAGPPVGPECEHCGGKHQVRSR